MDEYKDQSGIIYCFSRKQVDTLTQELQKAGLSVKPYHAGLSDEERSQNQEQFVRDDIQIIVATIAFGMGINKPNVRFVIHFDIPKNLESYYQEIGRAGRDGLPAQCIMLFGYGDIRKVRYFIDQMEDSPLKQNYLTHLDSIVKYAESTECRRVSLINYFGETYTDKNCAACDNCVQPAYQSDDITRQSILFLRTIKESGQYFGSEHIIDILRESKSQKIDKFRHHELPVYGKGKEMTKTQWMDIRNQLIRLDFIIKDMEKFGVLKLTPKGLDVLNGHLKVLGKSPEVKTEKQKITVQKPLASQYDQKLFELLRKKRKEISDYQGVPPYIIFHDTALIHMATIFPTTVSAFKNITGVGEKKLEHFGPAFITIIKNYCNKN